MNAAAKPPGDHAGYGDALVRIENTVQDIHRRLFVDNGAPCIQTRINRLDGWLAVIRYVVLTIIGAITALWIKKT